MDVINIKLNVNQKISVSTSEILNNDPDAFYSSRVEEVSEKYITIAMPMDKGVPLYLGYNDVVIGRIFASDGSSIFLFKSEFIKRTMDPLPVWIIGAPYDVSKVQRRAFFRLDISLKVKLTRYKEFAEDGSTLPDTEMSFYTGNISGGGLLLVNVAKLLEEGEHVFLDIELNEQETVRTMGKVGRIFDYINDLTGRAEKRVGIGFEGMDEQDIRKIVSFINRKLLQMRKNGV